MNIREKTAVLLQGNNSLLYQSFPSPLKLMQLMMTSRSAEFKCSSIHLRMKGGKKHRKPRNKLQTAQTQRDRERERERQREREREREGNCRLIQERLQIEEQQKGNKEERKGGKALSIKE